MNIFDQLLCQIKCLYWYIYFVQTRNFVEVHYQERGAFALNNRTFSVNESKNILQCATYCAYIVWVKHTGDTLTDSSSHFHQSHWNNMNVMLFCRKGGGGGIPLLSSNIPLSGLAVWYCTMHAELLLLIVYCHWGSSWKTNIDISLGCEQYV